MTKTARGLSEHPESTDDFVRDLEESGYPVDGATEQFVPQPDSLPLEAARPGLPPVPLDGGHETLTASSANNNTGRARAGLIP